MKVKRLGGTVAGAVLCIGGLGASSIAHADTRIGADVSLTGKVSSNPFGLATAGNEAAVSITPRVSPWLMYSDPDTTAELRTDLYVDQYTSRYGSNTTGSADLSIMQKLSERFSLRAGGHYSDSSTGLHDALLNRNVASETLTPGELLPDVSTGGLRTRIKALSARLGASMEVSSLDSFTLDFTGARTQTDAPGSADYYYGSAALGYARKISDRTSATFQTVVSRVNYANQREGDGTIINPELGVRHQLGPNWRASLSVGASFSRIEPRVGATQSFTVLSGQASICDAFRSGELCLNAARVAQPTAIGGIVATSDVSLDLNRTLSRRDRIYANVRYSTTDQSSAVLGSSTQFVGATVNFMREFTRQFNVFVSPSISKIYDGVRSREANWQVSLGLRYSFGAEK